MTLTPDSLRQIEREIAKYPPDQKRSAVMSALRIAQEEKGWLSTETIEYVAQYLGLPAIAVYEVASFYTMYDIVPVGKYKISICTNLPCALSGAAETADHLKRRLGIDFNETSSDNRFTLKQGECFGACGDAPVLLINNKKMLSYMSPSKVDEFLEQLG